MALPIYIPLGYITFLVSLLWLFSRHHRRRASMRKPPAPWFAEPHTARDVYISLLSLEPPPPQPVLIAALLTRAMADVRRIWALRDAKQALTILVQKGQVGDDLWERLLVAEKELEAEIMEVVGEANEYAPGWGQAIFAIASEAATSQKNRDIYKGLVTDRDALAARLDTQTLSASPGQLSILGSKRAVRQPETHPGPTAPEPTERPAPPSSAPPPSVGSDAPTEEHSDDDRPRSNAGTPKKQKKKPKKKPKA